MELSKNIAKIKDKNGRKIKNPSLEELVKFYGVKMPKAEYHNALVDTEATLEVFKAMINLPIEKL
jgi:DNA polymerase III epsilon subunit-like protein